MENTNTVVQQTAQLDKIEFVPMMATMNLTTKALEEKLFKNMANLGIDGLKGVAVKIKQTSMAITIGLKCNSRLLEKNPVAIIVEGHAAPMPTKELVDKLKGKFIRNAEDLNVKQIKNVAILELDPQLTLDTIIEKDPGYLYQIGGLMPMGNIGMIQIVRVDKVTAEQAAKKLKNKNHNNNNGNKNNNNNHHKGNKNNRNNYRGNNNRTRY